MTFACIFTGFAESRPWACRVFSFKIAPASQKARVFPFTFAPGCPQSHVLRVFLHVFVHLCVILSWCAAVCGRAFLSQVDILMHFLRCFLRAVYGNVVFFRSKMDAHHKRLVFFRSFLLTSVANPMFCVYLFAYFAEICVVLRCALQSVACSS